MRNKDRRDAAPRWNAGRSSPRRRPAFVPDSPAQLDDRTLLSLAFGNAVGFGSTANGVASVNAAATAIDAQGARFVAGSFFGSLNFGSTSLSSAGGSDGYVAKFNPDGSLAYLRQLASPADEKITGLALDASGNAYLTGMIAAPTAFGGGLMLAPSGNPAVFAWSLDALGSTRSAALVTSNSIGSAVSTSIAVTPNGNALAISGIYSGTVQVPGSGLSATASTGAQNGFVLALSSIGSPTWLADMKGAAGARSSVNQVAFDPQGNVDAAGGFTGSVDFDPGTGNNTRTSLPGGSDIAVVEYNGGTGGLANLRVIGGYGLDSATGVAVDRLGNVFVTGPYQQAVTFGPGTTLAAPSGTTGVFLMGLTPSGAVGFARDLGAYDSDLTQNWIGRPSVAVNRAGSVVAAASFVGQATTGRFWLNGAGGRDLVVQTFDPTGRLIQANSAGGSGDEVVGGLAINDTGGIALAGQYTASAMFGNSFLLARTGAAPGQNVFSAAIHSTTPVINDFDGTGHTEPSLFRAGTGEWLVYGPFGKENLGKFGGLNLSDIPAPGDYQAVGHAQVVVYRPSTAEWLLNTPYGPQVLARFGAPGLDIPVPGDYDGLGYTQPAVFRPTTGEWIVLGPYGSHSLGTFGGTNLYDMPVPGDYDGVGYTQPAVYRPWTAQWFVKGPNGSRMMGTYGAPGLSDIPAPGDYDGNGKDEPTVFRPSTSQWYNLATTGSQVHRTFGALNLVDMPAQAGPLGFIKSWINRNSKGGITAQSITPATLASLPPPQLAGTVVTKPVTATPAVVPVRPRPAQATTVGAAFPSRRPLTGQLPTTPG